MVDTINHNQNNDQSQNNGRSFYRGFNRPDEIKVNLAGKHEEKSSSNEPIAPSPISANPAAEPAKPETQPIQPTKAAVSSPEPVEPIEEVVKPVTSPTPEPGKLADIKETKVGPTYQTARVQKPKEPINWRGLIVVFASGLVLAAIFGGVTFYVTGLLNKKKIDQQNTELNDLNNKINSLSETPAPLVLPKVETPASNAVPATPTVETPPVEQPKIQEETPPTPVAGQG